ncbi:MAG: ClpXP protease specificity-enhancing factor SspB [Alphaproteobacteria bacterium]
MTDQELRYDVMVQTALRNVVKEALTLVAEHGLPGDHHFYLAFNPQHPEAVVPDFLKEKFGEEMSIVLQHQFWDLKVTDDGFGVTLQFDRKPYELWVPFDAMRGFFDPSVQFGLQFQDGEDDDAEIDDELGSHLGLATFEGEPQDDLSELSDEELFASFERNSNEEDAPTDTESPDDDGSDDTPNGGGKGAKSGEVIALDQFRKKP